MGTIGKLRNDYNDIASATLTIGTKLDVGTIGNSGTVDGLFTGTSSLVSIPANTDLITNVIFNFVGISGIGGALKCSIGTNGPNYNNIMPQITLTGWTATTDIYNYIPTGVVHKPTSGETITINITTAFTGVTALFEVIFLGKIV